MAALVTLLVGVHSASADEAFKLQKDGKIFSEHFSGDPWVMLDNNPATREITAYAGSLYQLHDDGSIFRYTNTPCNGNTCLGWEKLDNNPAAKAIYAGGIIGGPGGTGGGALYQLHQDGSIWQYTFKPCDARNACTGWVQFSNGPVGAVVGAVIGNPAAVQLTGAATSLYQLHSDGSIWEHIGTFGAPKFSDWVEIDKNPATKLIAAGEINELYQLHSDGSIYQHITSDQKAPACCAQWKQLDNNPKTVSIVTDNNWVYQLRNDGTILVYKGSWQQLDNNPLTVQISAGFGGGTTGTNALYQMHKDGSIWSWFGGKWTLVDTNSANAGVVVNGSVFLR